MLRALLDAVLDGAPNERGSLLALAREKMSLQTVKKPARLQVSEGRIV